MGLRHRAESGGRARPSGWASALFGPLPADVPAVAAKDLVVLPRDLQRMAVMLIPVAAVPGYALLAAGAANLKRLEWEL